MQFRLLGPVEVEVASGMLPLSRRQERCLLAVLLLDQGRAVSCARLAEVLWEGVPPDRARRTIHTHVARLRAELAQVDARGQGVDLVSAGGGYRIVLDDPAAVDVHRFRELRSKASNGGDRSTSVAWLRAALDLWRGPALQGTASDWQREQLCTDLEELRLATLEDFLAGSLELGREQEVLPELAAAAAAHPGRERLAELHMHALHRLGRKVDALAVFARTRSYLVEELGLDPGPALIRLHQAILRDQCLPTVPLRATPGEGMVDATVPRQLPADVAGFTGRAAALAELDGALPRPGPLPPLPPMTPITVIAGMAGVGKTALALHWAHRVADRFPDGQLYLNLRGFDPGGPPLTATDALRGLIEALGVPAQRIPSGLDAQVNLYRSRLAGRKMLVVLDNARDADQVRPLLPGGAGCLVVVTSRDQLFGLVAVEGGRPVKLDLFSPDEARTMLARRLGGDRVDAEPAAADAIIDQCGRLPLALAITAARAAINPSFPLGELAASLAGATGLDAVSRPHGGTDLRAVFSWSYQALSAGAARLFRLLGLHPGPDLAAAAAASLAGVPMPEADRLLAELVDTHIIGERVPGRYALHDLVHAYAIELVETAEHDQDRNAARLRMLDHYLHTSYASAVQLNPRRTATITLDPPAPEVALAEVADQAWALAWFSREYPVLLAAVDHANANGFDGHTWRLAWTLAHFCRRQGHWHAWLRVAGTALEAAHRLADRLAQANAHTLLALPLIYLGADEDAAYHLQQAFDQFVQLGDLGGQAHSHLNLNVLRDRRGQREAALSHARQALALYQAAADPVGQAHALNAVGWLHAQLGAHQQALHHCQQALALQQRLGDRLNEMSTWDSLGYVHHALGQHVAAARCYQRAVELARDYGHRDLEADILTHLGDTHRATGDLDSAGRAWRTALGLLQELNRPDADQVRARLRCLPDDRLSRLSHAG